MVHLNMIITERMYREIIRVSRKIDVSETVTLGAAIYETLLLSLDKKLEEDSIDSWSRILNRYQDELERDEKENA